VSVKLEGFAVEEWKPILERTRQELSALYPIMREFTISTINGAFGVVAYGEEHYHAALIDSFFEFVEHADTRAGEHRTPAKLNKRE